jgi:hypothetical protein
MPRPTIYLVHLRSIVRGREQRGKIAVIASSEQGALKKAARWAASINGLEHTVAFSAYETFDGPGIYITESFRDLLVSKVLL